ncbi:MOSC domain-containing protein [Arthrobacter sp. NEB 688]|nr:MOSC domain-containing protein [Arthrobacter sp. NEB 688]
MRSVNVGASRDGVGSRGRASAIDKQPVASVEVRDPGPKRGGLGSGVVGDDVVSRRHHGGSSQAVYAVAREELDHWGGVLERVLPDGQFGENLTTQGLDVDGAVVGERWRVGSALLEVTGPRIPCATFGAWMGERGWVRRFTERGRTGAYLAVVEPGTVSTGDVVEVLERPAHGIVVPRVFRALCGDLEAADEVLGARVLDAQHHAELERSVARRTP